MSKITNPETEQSVTCGFYNSIGDRKYNAIQMSKLFDGIIRDGVFASIGSGFAVTVPENSPGAIVNVGTGKCWFNHTWTENDAVLPVECPESEVALNRIDAIIIRVDSNETVRDNFITVKTGTPSSYPSRPTMTHDDNVNEYAICYIQRKANSTTITPSDITHVVGEDETPFITGVLETFSSDEFMQKWRYELDQFVANKIAEIEAFKDSEKNDLEEFMTNQENSYKQWYADMQSQMSESIDGCNEWITAQENTILDWFSNMRNQLSTDAATNLQMQFDKSEVERILINGFSDGTKIISEDGTSIESTDSTGRRLVKSFTDEFRTCTTILYSSHGSEIGRLVKTFSNDGLTIRCDMTII